MLLGFHHDLLVGIVGNLVVVDDTLQGLFGLQVVAATVEDVREGKCPILALKKLEGNTHTRVGGVQLTPVSELEDDLPFD